MKIQKTPYCIVLEDIYNSGKGVLRELLYHKDFDVSYNELLNIFKEPIDYEKAVSSFGKEKIDFLLREKLLLESSNIWFQTNIENLEIEICSHCNWRCQYCPVSFDPKSPKVMNMDLFCEIIDKAVEHGSVKYVTFNSYNEPLLDKHFLERIEYLSKTKLKLRLHTNGSVLTKKTLDYLKNSNVLKFICFNIPSVEPAEFKKMTGSNSFERVIKNIDYAIQIGLPVTLSVQGTRYELKRNLKPIQMKFGNRIKNIEPWGTYDRAGLLRNRYFQNIFVKGNLYGGCHSILNWLNISVDGDCFICSNDYYQKYKWANIQDGSIKTICSSQKSVDLRRSIYGDLPVDDDFICRRCITMKRAKLLYRFQKGEI